MVVTFKEKLYSVVDRVIPGERLHVEPKNHCNFLTTLMVGNAE